MRQATRRIFAYGTLELSGLIEALLGRLPAAEPAVLRGYARRRVRSADYPGLAPCAGAEVLGTLYFGIDAPELARLDAFEGDLYQRVRVVPRGIDGRSHEAETYVVRPERLGVLETGDFDRERFAAAHLPAWLHELRRRRGVAAAEIG